MTNNNSYLIFDFDGTLVDSFHIAMGKFNLLHEQLKKIALKKIGVKKEYNAIKEELDLLEVMN